MSVRAAALLGLLSVCCLPAPAQAHLGSTKYLRVERTSTGAHLEVDVEAVDASMQLGLGPEPHLDALKARGDEVTRWLARGIAMHTDGGEPCEPSPGELRATERDQRPYLSLSIDYRCPGEAGELVLRDDTVFPDDPQHEAIVRRAYAERVDAVVLRQGSRQTRLGEPPAWWHLAGVFVREGMLHLATGYDHVLFLLSLILASGFVAARQGLRIALRDVVVLVTAFTVGHSVTLIAAALGVVVLPSRLVETVIAASIVAVAAFNLWRPGWRGPMPWLAFGFGLVHGFGFSSVLAELGLPRERTVLALVSFNVGIELAQLAFVALLLGPIAWSAQLPSYRNLVVRGGSAVIAVLAGLWLVERAFGL